MKQLLRVNLLTYEDDRGYGVVLLKLTYYFHDIQW